MRAVALLLVVCCSAPGSAGAAGVRYALVVGNNRALSPEEPLEDLRHAEREARWLHGQLLDLGQFDRERAILVTGGGRADILKAAHTLAERHRRDRQQLGDLPTLFAFFFSGHGLSGRLLTRDGPLTGDDLAAIFAAVGADLNVGFFDACFAGSLDIERLSGKGAVPTPGFNPINALPAEVLNAEGTMWFVSSRPDELSYEDEQLGGLLTHFFVEGFAAAPADGVAVTLDSLWEYARQRTARYAARHGRRQTPEKIVRRLKASGPIYFSFPRAREARLVFDPEVAGSFLVEYADGALVELVEKRPGQPLRLSMYSGEAMLRSIDDPQRPARIFELTAGSEVHVRRDEGLPARPAAGFAQARIRSKGSLPGLTLTERVPSLTTMVTGGYRFAWVDPSAVGAMHMPAVGARIAYGLFGGALRVAYGHTDDRFATWSVAGDHVELGAEAGLGFDLGGPRLELNGGAAVTIAHLSYFSGEQRRHVGGWLGAGGSLFVPIPWRAPLVLLQLQATIGGALSGSLAASGAGARWRAQPRLAVALALPVLVGD